VQAPCSGHTRATTRERHAILAACIEIVAARRARLLYQTAKRLGDRLVAIPGGMLINERSSRARMTEMGHQLLEARASSSGKRAADVPQVVEVQLWRACLSPGGVPDRAEVGPAQWGAFRADEDQSPLPRLSEALQMPAQLGHKLIGEGDRAAASSRLRCLRQKAALSSSAVVSTMRISLVARSTFPRRSPTSSPQSIPPKVASRAIAR
jgi:hypothetical protein